MANQKSIVKPNAILLDTNIFYRFVPFFTGFELKKILKLCNTLDIKTYTTELVIKELHHLCKKDIEQRRNTILGNTKHLKGYGVLANENLTSLLKKQKVDLMNFLKNQMQELGITIIPTPELSLKGLVDRAVSHVAPFESGDKGFKDTVILMTYLEHLASTKSKSAYILTTDKIFNDEDAEKLANESNVELSVFIDMTEAIDNLTQSLESEVKQYYATQENIIKEFLETELPKILEHIKNAGYSEHFLRKSEQYPFNATLVKINDIQIKRITKVYISDESKINNKIKFEIMFMVETQFLLLMRVFKFRKLFQPYHYLKKSVQDVIMEGQEKNEEKPIKIGVNISATLLYDESKKECSDLQIGEQNAYFM